MSPTTYTISNCKIYLLHGSVFLEFIPVKSLTKIMDFWYNIKCNIDPDFVTITKCDTNVSIEIVEAARRFRMHKIMTPCGCMKHDFLAQFYSAIWSDLISRQLHHLGIDYNILKDKTYVEVILDFFKYHRFVRPTEKSLDVNPELRERYMQAEYFEGKLTENFPDVISNLQRMRVIDDPANIKNVTSYMKIFDKPITVDDWIKDWCNDPKIMIHIFVRFKGKRMMSILVDKLLS